jgi:hypothetical protein
MWKRGIGRDFTRGRDLGTCLLGDLGADKQTWWIEKGEIKTGSIHPTRDFGLPTHPLSSVRGSTPDLNALTFTSILENASQPPAHLSSPASTDSPSLCYMFLDGLKTGKMVSGSPESRSRVGVLKLLSKDLGMLVSVLWVRMSTLRV